MIARSASTLAILATCISLCPPASPASAGTVFAANAESVAAALRNNGYQAKVEKGDDGNPQIITSSGGNKMILTFSSCTNGDKCEYIEIISSWTGADETSATNAVRKWNAEEHFSSVIYAPNGKYISMYHYVITGRDGISDSSLVDTIEYFNKEYVQLGNSLAPSK